MLGDEEFELDKSQQHAYDNIIHMAMGKTKHTVIVLTGEAGSGKSTITSRLLKKRELFRVCATTGKAAILLGCPTVDRIFQFKRPSVLGKPYVLTNSGKLDEIMRQSPVCIIIDEASMAGYGMCAYIHEVALQYKKRIVLVGDWAQASPVKDEWGIDSDLFKKAEVFNLPKSYRQSSDSAYRDVLNKLRLGIVDKSVSSVMMTRVTPPPTFNDDVTKIFALNSRVDRFNLVRLKAHCMTTGEQTLRLKSLFTDVRPVAAQEAKPIDPIRAERMLLDGRLCHNEQVAIGSYVMITMNIWDEESRSFLACNGDVGIIKNIAYALTVGPVTKTVDLCALKRDSVIWKNCMQAPITAVYVDVELTRNKQLIRLSKEDCEIESETQPGTTEFKLSGIPIVLAYAITIHKSQGATLAKAWVDMSSISYMRTRASQHGLAYVALSRTRTLNDLTIGSWVPGVVYCDDAVKPFIEGVVNAENERVVN